MTMHVLWDMLPNNIHVVTSTDIVNQLPPSLSISETIWRGGLVLSYLFDSQLDDISAEIEQS